MILNSTISWSQEERLLLTSTALTSPTLIVSIEVQLCISPHWMLINALRCHQCTPKTFWIVCAYSSSVNRHSPLGHRPTIMQTRLKTYSKITLSEIENQTRKKQTNKQNYFQHLQNVPLSS